MLGNYEHRIDQKGRVAIPAKFRKEFVEGAVLTTGIDSCIIMYPRPEWHKISDNYDYTAFANSKKRQLMRIIFANATDVEMDKQGRVALSPWLKEHAEIKDVVMVIGSNKYLEIWSKESWDQERLRMAEAAWQLAEGSEDN